VKSSSNELWQEYIKNKNPVVKEKLVLEYISLVKNIANKISFYVPGGISKDDLYGYGIFGLLEAVERFNPEMGIPFSGYAVKRIKGAIIDGLRKEDWVPAGVRKKAKLISQSYQRVEMSLLRSATDEEIALDLNISLQEFYLWLKQLQYVTLLSLDEPFNDTACKQENVFDRCSPDPQAAVEAKEIKTLLAEAVDGLPEKEKTVVTLFYYEELTNKEIAGVLKLSDSRVSQLHTKAIFRLRGRLARNRKNHDL